MKINTTIEVTPEEAATFLKELSPAKDIDKFQTEMAKIWAKYWTDLQEKALEGKFPYYKSKD